MMCKLKDSEEVIFKYLLRHKEGLLVFLTYRRFNIWFLKRCQIENAISSSQKHIRVTTMVRQFSPKRRQFIHRLWQGHILRLIQWELLMWFMFLLSCIGIFDGLSSFFSDILNDLAGLVKLITVVVDKLVCYRLCLYYVHVVIFKFKFCSHWILSNFFIYLIYLKSERLD